MDIEKTYLIGGLPSIVLICGGRYKKVMFFQVLFRGYILEEIIYNSSMIRFPALWQRWEYETIIKRPLI